MAFEITQRAQSALNSKLITPQIVVKIDGYNLFTSAEIMEVTKYGSPGLVYGAPGFVYGGSNAVNNQDTFISLVGTSTQVTQQILPDQGAASSTTNMTIALLNKENSLGYIPVVEGLDDILSKKAEIFLGVQGTGYPEDFIRIFVGNITEVNTSAGIIKLKVAHPEHLKRSDLFQKITSELTSTINDSVTTIPVLSTEGMLLPSALFKTYVRIEDEIIRYTGLTPTSLTGCARSQFDTIAVAHDDETSTDTFYVLGDGTSASNAIDLTLKVLMSGAESPWIYNLDVTTLGISIDPATLNSVFIPGESLEDSNVIPGDTATITNATAPNNYTDATITDVRVDSSGTRITLDSAFPLTPEISSTAKVSIKSQYNTLPDGVGLTPDQVDIAEFTNTKALFISSMPNYEIYLKDSISGKDLVNKEMLYPAACYSIPRKGRVSLGKTKPPILAFQSKTLDNTNVLNASKLSVDRSMLDNFYNAVIYKFDIDAVEDKFRAGRVILSQSSFNRIRTGTKPFLVESLAIRKTNDNLNVLENNSQRILDRYQFGAESIKDIKVPFSVGFGVEVGDTSIIKDLQLLDSKTGLRNLAPRVMEVVNKSFNFKTGEISLDLTDTAYGVDGRYGVVSPSSLTTSSSTDTELYIKKSFSTTDLEREYDKWVDYVGLTIKVRSPDFSDVAETVFTGFSPSNSFVMLVDPALPFTPAEDYIIEIADYDTAESLYKIAHCYFNPQELVVSNSSDNFTFEVDDGSIFFVGCTVRVHNFNYSVDSGDVVVSAISGDDITVSTDLGFAPQTDYEVDLTGFSGDNGSPYRIL